MALLFGVFYFYCTRWPLAPTFAFVQFEHGQNLHLAHHLLSGEQLYRDIFSQYGPLPIYAYAAVAYAFGNSAETYLGYLMGADLVAFLLAGFLLRRWYTPAAALFALCVGLGGRILRGVFPNPYPPWEAILFLAALLCWKSPTQRTVPRSMAIGLFLGLMQSCKFGSAAFAGGAIIVADWFQWKSEGKSIEWMRWVLILLATSTGFVLAEGGLAAGLFFTLPFEQACDVLWPAYLKGSYQSYVEPGVSFVAWRDARFFVTTQLPVITSIGVVIATAGRNWRHDKAEIEPCSAEKTPFWVWTGGARNYRGLAIGIGSFFPLAFLAGYLPHFWVAIYYLWIPWIAALACLPFMTRTARWLMACLMVGGAWAATINPLLRGTAAARADLSKVIMPNFQPLWLQREEGELFSAVSRRAEAMAIEANRPVRWIFIEGAFGWEHYAGGRLLAGSPNFRHHWFMHGFVRPREFGALLASLDEVDALLADLRLAPLGKVIDDPSTWGRCNPGLEPATARAFLDHFLPPEEIRRDVWLFRRKREARPALSSQPAADRGKLTIP